MTGRSDYRNIALGTWGLVCALTALLAFWLEEHGRWGAMSSKKLTFHGAVMALSFVVQIAISIRIIWSGQPAAGRQAVIRGALIGFGVTLLWVVAVYVVLLALYLLRRRELVGVGGYALIGLGHFWWVLAATAVVGGGLSGELRRRESFHSATAGSGVL